METKEIIREMDQCDDGGGGSGGGGRSGGRGSSSSSLSSPRLRNRRIRRKLTDPPPFVTKTFELVGDPKTDNIISWTNNGTSFTVSDNFTFCKDVLPMYFRHNNWTSFYTQLNFYGFKKISWESWEFANKWFQEGKEELLINIKNRNQRHGMRPCVDLGNFGLEAKVEKMKSAEKNLKHAIQKVEQEQEVMIQRFEERQNDIENQMATLKEHRASLSKQDELVNLVANAFVAMFSPLRQKRKIVNGESSEVQKLKVNEPGDANGGTDDGKAHAISETHIPDSKAADLTFMEKLMQDDPIPVCRNELEDEFTNKEPKIAVELPGLTEKRDDWGMYVRELL